MSRVFVILNCFLVVTALAGMAHGEAEQGKEPRSAGAVIEIELRNFFFNSNDVTINVGDTIRWINRTSTFHTTTSGTNCTSNGTWDQPLASLGSSFERTFNKLGTFPYFCRPHCGIGMTGTITVVQTAPCLFGDINDDGNVNIVDVVAGLKIAAGVDSQPSTEDELCRMDVDANQVVNILDTIKTLRIALQLD
jgi:plastocyanin